MVARTGGAFDRTEARQERLRQAPGEAARQAVAPTAPAPPPSRWSFTQRVPAVRATFPWWLDARLRGVWRLLQRCDWRRRAARVRHYSPDPAYAAQEARLLRCLHAVARHPTALALVLWDAMGSYRWPNAANTWSPRSPTPSPTTDPAGPHTKQWRGIGALNAVTGQVDYVQHDVVGRRHVIQVYRQLDQVYGKGHRLYVVQDTWSIHQHPDVLEALPGLPRIAPIWLPTYAPWLNPIEKLWRWLRQDQLVLHRLADDWTMLRRRVNALLDQFAHGSHAVLRYGGLRGEGKLARALQPT
jgi:hypothetical protein